MIKAFAYKYTYCVAKENGIGQKFNHCNLNNLKVYNLFVAEVMHNVADPYARDYILKVINTIAKNDFSKNPVRQSYINLHNILILDQDIANGIRKYAIENPGSFIDFNNIFEVCNYTPITKEHRIYNSLLAVSNFDKNTSKE